MTFQCKYDILDLDAEFVESIPKLTYSDFYFDSYDKLFLETVQFRLSYDRCGHQIEPYESYELEKKKASTSEA